MKHDYCTKYYVINTRGCKDMALYVVVDKKKDVSFVCYVYFIYRVEMERTLRRLLWPCHNKGAASSCDVLLRT